MKFIEKIKDFDYKSLFKKKEKAEPVWFAATKANTHHFEPGMFWYEDNTFSHELFFNKALRAIVIGVKHGRVIGLLPVERTLGAADADAFKEKIPKTLEKGVYQKCYSKLPQKSDWHSMYLHRDAINHALAEAGWMPLSGIYWCWSGLFHSRVSDAYDFILAKKIKSIGEAKGRYLIELTLI